MFIEEEDINKDKALTWKHCVFTSSIHLLVLQKSKEEKKKKKHKHEEKEKDLLGDQADEHVDPSEEMKELDPPPTSTSAEVWTIKALLPSVHLIICDHKPVVYVILNSRLKCSHWRRT